MEMSQFSVNMGLRACLFFSKDEDKARWIPKCLAQCVHQNGVSPDDNIAANPFTEELD